MFQRQLKINKNNSLFLFGARGTGKTTFLKEHFKGKKTLWIDLLKEEEEELYRKHPEELSARLKTKKFDWVVIDEVQKLPKLLDRVHLEIEEGFAKFVLTGSSVRKLKANSANLLAGRAFTNYFYPLTFQELGAQFNLEQALQFGTMPKLFSFKEETDIKEYLNSYVTTYLSEEIIREQIVRNIHPFKDFLKVAAQTNGQIVNFSNIAEDLGVDDKTVHNYFSILEDTLLGFYLRPYHRSVRKRQREAPKFYLFDTGVKRAMEKSLRVPIEMGTYAFGQAFEHRVILEAHWMSAYQKLDLDFFYMRTKDDAEVDLIIERPGQKTLIVEIKSTTQVKEKDARALLGDGNATDPAISRKLF